MLLDPTIAAAVVTASGGLIEKLIEIAGKSEPNAQAKKSIDKTYNKLAQQVTTHSVRVLRALRQEGSYQSPRQVLDIVGPMAKRQEPGGKDFEVDLTYRLKFLCVLGLVQMASNTDYAITHFGVAFLTKGVRGGSRAHGHRERMLDRRPDDAPHKLPLTEITRRVILASMSDGRRIVRYRNRKLYEARERRFVTLEDLAKAVSTEARIEVIAADTGEDITARVLSRALGSGKPPVAASADTLARIPRAGSEAAETVAEAAERVGATSVAASLRKAFRPEKLGRTLAPFTRKIADARQDVEKIVGGLVEKGRLTWEEGARLRDDVGPEACFDREGIHRCLLNLLSNAIDACLDAQCEGKPGEVLLRSRKTKERAVEYQVIDNGCGMDAEVREKIFQRFFSTKGSKGTGLGLMITRKIIDEHGGGIEVESAQGRGTTFTIRLTETTGSAKSKAN